jgi:arsenate reductase-like glutaredoxin family protein
MSSIDLFYARPSCESCDKTRALLAAAKVAIRSERSTRDALTEADVVDLLRSVEEVWIARGRKIVKQRAATTKPDQLLGPTGKFRAPLLRRGGRLLVGFHVPSLEELVA